MTVLVLCRFFWLWFSCLGVLSSTAHELLLNGSWRRDSRLIHKIQNEMTAAVTPMCPLQFFFQNPQDHLHSENIRHSGNTAEMWCDVCSQLFLNVYNLYNKVFGVMCCHWDVKTATRWRSAPETLQYAHHSVFMWGEHTYNNNHQIFCGEYWPGRYCGVVVHCVFNQ